MMSGEETWKIVGPILAAMLPENQKPLEVMSDAYVTTYIALKQYDEGKGKNNDKR